MIAIGGKDIKSILSGYDLTGDLKVKQIRSVYLISNGFEEYILKPLRIGSIQTNLITNFFEIYQQYQIAPMLVKTIHNSNYHWYQGNRYLLTKRIIGREADYLDDHDLIAAIKSMQLLHHYTCLHTQSNRGKWSFLKYDPIKKWTDCLAEMNVCKNRATKLSDEFSKLYIHEWNFYYEFACQSITEYQKVSRYQEQVFCYHDWAYHNVIIDQSDKANLFDFDYMILDRPVHDRCNLIGRYLRLNDWSLAAFRRIIDYFSCYYPWSDSELQYLKIYLSFPYDYWIIGRQYFIEKQKWSLKYYLEQLNWKIIRGKRIQQVLNVLEKLC